ncbi:hypothetical protein BDV12DRAFT_161138 [Aspergillus spectabilis]
MSRFSHSQQAQGPTTLARFQLAKFSYCTTSINYRGPLPWSHVFGNGDMVGIFEKNTTPLPARIFFKVLQNDQQTLEEICITDFMKEFEGQINSKQNGAKRPSFAVVVKFPCLAVKYPQANGYVRRIQIKFLSQRDFYSALAVLSDINCPFSESDVNSTQPMRRSVSSLSSLGHMGLVSGPKDSFSTASGSSISSVGSVPPYRPNTLSSVSQSGYSSSQIEKWDHINRFINGSNETLDATTQFSSSSSTTLCGSPLKPTNSRLNVPPVNDNPAADGPKQPNTFTGHHDTHATELQKAEQRLEKIADEMPPKRDLPFPDRDVKRRRSTPKTTAEGAPSATYIGASEPRKEVSETEATTKGVGDSNSTHTPLSPSSATDINRPNQATTAKTLKNEITPKPNFLPTSADLTKYTSDPTKERTAKLEGWICTHVSDNNFLQLCEDVEGVWRRFALGE